VTRLVHAFEKAQKDGFVIVLKLHPLDAIKNAGMKNTGMKNASAKRTEDEIWLRDESCVIIDSIFPLIDWYAAADVIITDYSGAAVEAAAAGAASYYYIYDMDEYMERRGLNVDLRGEAVGKYTFTDADALAEQVFQDFASEDESMYDYKALSGFAGKYLEVPLEGNTQRLASFIMKNLTFR
jgi:CDP-glycerol glycerophosphotransferase (TagB/SpsB family)